MAIPIQNIYYLLCYAWDNLAEADRIKVDIDKYSDPLNMLSHLYLRATEMLFKRGLDKSYRSTADIYYGIKGKIEFKESLKRNLFSQGKAVCTFDTFDEDITINQIVKAVLKRILATTSVDKVIRERAASYYSRIIEIRDIHITTDDFDKVHIHRNNTFYIFLLNIGRILIDSTTPQEGKEGDYVFQDFSRDHKKLATLFESFVRNFYRREQDDFNVTREDIEWNATALFGSDKSLLPLMKTDISLTSFDRKIIIDTKFYKNALVDHYDKKKIISHNLYQMYSYLKNAEDANCEGILLYPMNEYALDEHFQIDSHKIRVVTIDLNLHWSGIRQKLLNLLVPQVA